MEPWLIWLIVVVILAIIELVTVNLVTIWFVISGICASLATLFTDNIVIPFGIFVVGGIILLLTTKNVMIKYLNHPKEDMNLGRIINMKGIVIKKIIPDKNGIVKIDGKEWSAYSLSEIEEGKKVKVLKIKGVKLEVEEIE
ncbi:MAG: NfeD family protein [Bacilli bacterium]|nr:NfeD family protein [Bacilli bacterium]